MRVYLPGTLADLSQLARDRQIEATEGFAVTRDLRASYEAGSEEDLEYVAFLAAARASLSRLSTGTAPARRVVLAADVATAEVEQPDVTPGDRENLGLVRLRAPVPIARIEAIHVDGADAEPIVRGALQEPDDELRQEEVEDLPLLWYATQELGDLLR